MTELSGKSALVTGATGFIGGALARRLREAGARVHGVTRRAAADLDRDVRWWQADLEDVDDVRRVVDEARPDLVCHFASLVSGDRAIGMVLPALRANLLAAVNLMVASTERGVARLLLAGSMEEPVPSANWPLPSSPYAAAKFAAGAYARMCHALYGTPATWLRIFMVYGPGQRDHRKLIPYVTRSLLRGEAPAVSSGARAVDWVFVDDVVEGVLAAATRGGLEGRTVDIGSGRLVTVRSVVDSLVGIVGAGVSARYGAVADRPMEQVCVADVEATHASLAWRPRVSLEEGLERTVAWYRDGRGFAREASP
jgi:nucleoside-diphosphate-sugar epimerase